MINITQFLKNSINDYDPTIDTRDGSAVSDFLINPLSVILSSYDASLRSILDQLSLTNVEDIPEENMDFVAQTFLLERENGSKSYGNVYIYFNEPRSFTLPKGSFLTAGNLVFETSADYSITKTQMQSDISEYPYYVAGPVQIFAQEPGEEYNVKENTVFTFSTNINATPIKVINKQGFINGQEKETNLQLFERIKRSVYGNSLASPITIRGIIQDYSSDINAVEVIGAGNSLMLRDVVYSYTDLNSFHSEDFYLSTSGNHTGLYDKKHIAYTGNFVDSDPSTEVAFPSPNSWSREFSDDMYKGLYLKDDLEYSEQDNNIIVREFFTPPPGFQNDLALLMASGISSNTWLLHDGVNPTNSVFYPEEIRYQNSQLVLGYSKPIDAVGTMMPDGTKLYQANVNVNVPLSDILTYRSLLDKITIEKTHGIDVKQLGAFIEFLDFYADIKNSNNLSPVFHRPIDQHTGITIDCDMSTNDNTEAGEIAYITVLRNDLIHVPHDGFGLAWRKQPEYLIRMSKNNYATEADRARDLDRFFEEYQVDGTPLLGHIHEEQYKQYWKYNVYIVDNNVLQEEVWVGFDQVWNQASGKNQFLEAAKVWIEPYTTYSFKIEIGQYLGVRAWVWNPALASFNENAITIHRGQTFPTYVPQAGTKFTVSNGVQQLDASKNHFGIGVGNTKNCEWYVTNLMVRSFIESFAMHLFKFFIDPSKFDISQGLNVEYYGIGYDPENSVLDPNGANSKVKLGIYNTKNDAWEDLGFHLENVPTNSPLQIDDILINGSVTPITDYVDGDGYVYVAAAAANSPITDFPNNYEHSLRSYFVRIHDGEVHGMHRGNAVDVYCNDPNFITLGSVVGTVTGNSITTGSIQNIDPYIQEIVEVREHISQIPFDVSNYIVTNLSPGKTFSNDANYKITFDIDNMDGAQVEIVYRYWSRGPIINNLIVNSDHRYPSADFMVKVMPPTVIEIQDLKYSGGLPERQMRQKIRDYFNFRALYTFDKSDLVQVLYDNGATYVDLDMTIVIREYDTLGKLNIIELEAQRYIIPASNLSRLFMHLNDLQGVVQI